MHFILCFDNTIQIWWNYHPWHIFHFSTGRVILHWHSVSMVQTGSEGKQRSTIHFQWEGWTKRKVCAIPWKCPEYRIQIHRCNSHIVPDRIHHHSRQIGLQLMYKGLFIYFTVDSHIVAVKQSKTNIFSTTNKWGLHLYNIWFGCLQLSAVKQPCEMPHLWCYLCLQHALRGQTQSHTFRFIWAVCSNPGVKRPKYISTEKQGNNSQ